MDMSKGQRLDSRTQRYQPTFPADAGDGRQTSGDVIHPRVQAVMVAARFHGVELDPSEVVSRGAQDAPSAASLSEWAQSAGMWARAVRLRWRQLLHFVDTGPVVLLLTDGSATLMVGANAVSLASARGSRRKTTLRSASAPTIRVALPSVSNSTTGPASARCISWRQRNRTARAHMPALCAHSESEAAEGISCAAVERISLESNSTP